MKNFFKKIFEGIGCLGLAYRISYQFSLISMIPSSYIRSIPIRESDEPLVSVISSGRIIVFCPEESATLVRKTILNKLVAASSMLPNDFKLKIVYGYRNIEVQKKFWDEACIKIKEKYPSLSTEEVKIKARRYSALPNGKGPHQTGGAVDVLIVDASGKSLDFGGKYRGYGDTVPMHSKSITAKQRKNRKFLRDIMQSAGFAYYPGEWWHYSFGDQTWAAYTGNKYALYGFL